MYIFLIEEYFIHISISKCVCARACVISTHQLNIYYSLDTFLSMYVYFNHVEQLDDKYLWQQFTLYFFDTKRYMIKYGI